MSETPPPPVAVMPSPKGAAPQVSDYAHYAREREETRLETLKALWDPEEHPDGILGSMCQTGRILTGVSYILQQAFEQDLNFLDHLVSRYVNSSAGDELLHAAMDLAAERCPEVLAAVLNHHQQAPPPDDSA